MQNTKQIKSAFGPMRPSETAMDAALRAATVKTQPTANAVKVKPPSPPATASALKPPPKKDSPNLPPKQAEPSPIAAVEVWLEVVDRPDREVFSWFYIANRPPDRKAIVLTLKRSHWLVQQAISGSDARLLPLLASMTLAEFLLSRQKRYAWIAATLETLRSSLFSEPMFLSMQRLAEALAASPSFARLSSELTSTEPGKRHLIATISLSKHQPATAAESLVTS